MFTGKHLCQSILFEFCEFLKNTYFYRAPLVAASVFRIYLMANVNMNLLISPIAKQKQKTVKKTILNYIHEMDEP